MSVYLSCKVAATGSDDLKEAFVKQAKSNLPKGVSFSESEDVLFIGGDNYDARYNLLSIAECFSGFRNMVRTSIVSLMGKTGPRPLTV